MLDFDDLLLLLDLDLVVEVVSWYSASTVLIFNFVVKLIREWMLFEQATNR